MIAIFSTSSYGWLSLKLHNKNPEEKTFLSRQRKWKDSNGWKERKRNTPRRIRFSIRWQMMSTAAESWMLDDGSWMRICGCFLRRHLSLNTFSLIRRILRAITNGRPAVAGHAWAACSQHACKEPAGSGQQTGRSSSSSSSRSSSSSCSCCSHSFVSLKVFFFHEFVLVRSQTGGSWSSKELLTTAAAWNFDSELWTKSNYLAEQMGIQNVENKAKEASRDVTPREYRMYIANKAVESPRKFLDVTNKYTGVVGKHSAVELWFFSFLVQRLGYCLLACFFRSVDLQVRVFCGLVCWSSWFSLLASSGLSSVFFSFQ